MIESKFLTKLNITPCDDDESLWILRSPLVYQSALLGGILTVPAGASVSAKDVPGVPEALDGYRTDLASVPRIPIFYEIWGNRAHYESVPHDWLFQTHLAGFMMANRVFLESMKVRNKPPRIKYPMYTGVVLGGYWSYYTGPSRFKKLNPGLAIPPIELLQNP